jgi:transcriptional regulator with XRE-family HTH domain
MKAIAQRNLFQQQIFVDAKALSELELLGHTHRVATVGGNFKRIREAKGIKQEEIYKQLGYKRVSNVSLLENNKRLPKPTTIKKMAAVLGCETWELLEGVETPWDLLRDKESQRQEITSKTAHGGATKHAPFRRAGSAKDQPRKGHHLE